MLEIPGKFRLWDFFFQIISMFAKIFETVDFGQNPEKKTSILVKIFENLSFGQVIGNFDFVKNFWKSRF